MIETLLDAPECATQEQLDEMYTLHEAKQRGYIPGGHPLRAEEYMAAWEKMDEVDARWTARIARATTLGTALVNLMQMDRDHIAERKEWEDRLFPF